MKTTVLLSVACAALFSCSAPQPKSSIIDQNVEFAAAQVKGMVDSMESFDHMPSPRSFNNGKSVYTNLYDWTSGFFPGNLWYIYELTGDEQWKQYAKKYTEGMEHIKSYKDNHDIGFMIFCSFGNGLRLTGDTSYKPVIVEAARSLATRYLPKAQIIQSWSPRQGWTCPVIIDNMMNLELMFEATQMSGDSTFWNIAVTHADNTMKNHYREDMSCYHVVDYDPETGVVLKRQTAQGFADESAWSRGQAWGLYGYALCYRYTRDPKYLDQAEKIAAYLFAHPNMPEDLVPYWDFDATDLPNQPRDASAAAVIASALYELSTYSNNGQQYIEKADKIVESLSSPAYRAELGANGNYILMHSVGSIPHNSEIDVPLIYADYYFLEALKRKRDLENVQ